MLKKRGRQGFTLIEIVIVLAIITVLSLVAFPNYLRTRSDTYKKICINNMRQMDGAIDRWMFESGAPEDIGVPDAEQEAEIYSSLRGGKPACPAGGTYKIGTIGTYPQITCTVAGHGLPAEE